MYRSSHIHRWSQISRSNPEILFLGIILEQWRKKGVQKRDLKKHEILIENWSQNERIWEVKTSSQLKLASFNSFYGLLFSKLKIKFQDPDPQKWLSLFSGVFCAFWRILGATWSRSGPRRGPRNRVLGHPLGKTMDKGCPETRPGKTLNFPRKPVPKMKGFGR